MKSRRALGRRGQLRRCVGRPGRRGNLSAGAERGRPLLLHVPDASRGAGRLWGCRAGWGAASDPEAVGGLRADCPDLSAFQTAAGCAGGCLIDLGVGGGPEQAGPETPSLLGQDLAALGEPGCLLGDGAQLARLAALGALRGAYPCSGAAVHKEVSPAHPALGLGFVDERGGWQLARRGSVCVPGGRRGALSGHTGGVTGVPLCSHRHRRSCSSQQGEDARPWAAGLPSGRRGGRDHGLARACLSSAVRCLRHPAPPLSQPCVSRPGLRGLRRGPEGGATPPPGSWSLTPGLTPALPGLTGRRPRLPSGEAEPRRRRHVGPQCPEPLRGEQPPGPPHPAAPRRPAVSPLGGGQVAGSTPGCCPCPGPRGRASWVRTSPSRSLLLGTSPPRPGPRKTALSKGVALVMWLGVCRLGFSS